MFADLHRVADFNRTLEKEDQTRNKIVDDSLQPESETDAERTGENRKFRQIEAEPAIATRIRQREHIMEHRRDRIRHAAAEFDAQVNIFFQNKADKPRKWQMPARS